MGALGEARRVTTVDATYDGTVFRPRERVELPPNTEVRLIVEVPAVDVKKPASFLDTARSLKLEGPVDWSQNLDKYLYDEGGQGG